MESTSQHYVLKTEGLTKSYANKRVVDNVSLNVKKGDIYGFIGKNGAGKTTLMKMVAGLTLPDAGQLTLFDSDNVDLQRMRIGTLIEEPGLYPGLSAADNLELWRRAYGIQDKGIVQELLALAGISDTGKKRVRNFSMGMKQRLGIAIALLRGPDFLILDEPINGLDPEGIQQVRELLVKLNREQDITIMISSHILGELSKLATAYGIIRDGVLVEELSAAELAARCRRCRKLVVNDAGLAAGILEQELGIREYDVPEPSVIRIFGELKDIGELNRRLTLGGVVILESYAAGEDLEAYFMERVGGEVQ